MENEKYIKKTILVTKNVEINNILFYDNKYILSSYNGKITIIDSNTESIIYNFEIDIDWLRGLTIIGDFLIAGSYNILYIYDLKKNYEFMEKIKLKINENILSLNNYENNLIIGFYSKLMIYDLKKRKEIQIIESDNEKKINFESIFSLLIIEKKLLVGSFHNNKIFIFNINEKYEYIRYIENDKNVYKLFYYNSYLFSSSDNLDKRLNYYELDKPNKNRLNINYIINSSSFLINNDYLLVGSSKGELNIYTTILLKNQIKKDNNVIIYKEYANRMINYSIKIENEMKTANDKLENMEKGNKFINFILKFLIFDIYFNDR